MMIRNKNVCFLVETQHLCFMKIIQGWNNVCVCVCVCVCVRAFVFVTNEDTNVYNDMGMT